MTTVSTPVPVALRLLEREFLIACAPEEREGLLEAAAHLERKMRELRAHSHAPGFDRLAVLTAISITHEYLTLTKQQNGEESHLGEELKTMRLKLEQALQPHVE
ncbi:hypothetical protein RF55_18267 [Lasius niger]|uniref:Cell division protein ZapA n=1 Tax=Lasius niger TaxID=67767 RepID=A0A0J7MUK5_LASNI|nr:hypothetical protein RF55_18267 [Lasius niger]